MTPEDRIELLRWIREHRTYDGQDAYLIDADELEEWVLGLEAEAEPFRLEPPGTFHFEDVPVIDGVATLPDGRTVESTSDIVRVPILDSEKEGPR